MKKSNKKRSTGPSRVVPHRSTTPARTCLTSLFGWEAVSQADMAALTMILFSSTQWGLRPFLAWVFRVAVSAPLSTTYYSEIKEEDSFLFGFIQGNLHLLCMHVHCMHIRHQDQGGTRQCSKGTMRLAESAAAGPGCRARGRHCFPFCCSLLNTIVAGFGCNEANSTVHHPMTEETSKKTLHIDHCMWSIFFRLSIWGA